MKICECGCTKETHFMKDGACYGFTIVEGVAVKCPCTRFKKRSRRYKNQSPQIVKGLVAEDTPSTPQYVAKTNNGIWQSGFFSFFENDQL